MVPKVGAVAARAGAAATVGSTAYNGVSINNRKQSEVQHEEQFVIFVAFCC